MSVEVCDGGYRDRGEASPEMVSLWLSMSFQRGVAGNPEVRDNKKRSSGVLGECRRKKGDVLQMSCKKSLDGELLGPPCRSLGRKALNELDTGERSTCFFSSLPKTSSLSLSQREPSWASKFGLGGKFTLHLGMPLGAPFKSVTIWDGVEKRFRKRLAMWKPDPKEAWVKDVRSGTAKGVEVLALQGCSGWKQRMEFSRQSHFTKFLNFISNEEHLEVVCEAKVSFFAWELLGVWMKPDGRSSRLKDLMWNEEKGPSGKELEVNQVVEAYCLSKGKELSFTSLPKGLSSGFLSILGFSSALFSLASL
ncbi:hypothetical protein CK203_024724 [Vitis vinifera]|uniref:Uncharacterized protein n=1 Tax=Vitis vinifera TaxID=29760 RepID=A0A438ITF5_VITVI|nr:hypothetical protein CK203_024724 [Vitis vinifera]